MTAKEEKHEPIVEKSDVRFILSLILVCGTILMCGYAVAMGDYEQLKTIMSTVGVLASSVVAHYFGTKSK